jgi:capsule polysaccharide modification protein KpsS
MPNKIIKTNKTNQNLYSPNRLGSKPRTKTGFANATTARKTLKNIAHFDMTYQKQVVITMYNRAKFHPHRTHDMLKAMKVYSSWMAKYNKNKKTNSSKKTNSRKRTKKSK